MTIPKQLQNESFRFVKLKPKSKIPFEPNWQNNGYTWKEIKDWVNKGNNYGVIGGRGDLRILDTDNLDFAKEMKEKLPKTFTVKTGNGGLHFYFITDYNQNHVLKDNKGELRSFNYQVVGVNSRHPNGNLYQVEVDEPIASIDSNTLKTQLEPFIRTVSGKTTFDATQPKDTSRSGKEFIEVLKMIKDGKSKEQIYQDMMVYSKWYNAPPQYRDLTYNKANKIIKGDTSEESEEYVKESLEDIYNKIVNVLKFYCDLREEYYGLIALWIMGTYVHKQFYSFPYLFINAMKASGKSRLLKLISTLSYNGEYLNNINEAVMFRIADKSTFCIDEFESIGKKEKSALRELLNGAYKKGMKVKRNRRVSGKFGDNWVIDDFNIFCPIAMANIWGMDNVLEDRCISLNLEKSSNSKITNLIEMFENDGSIIEAREALVYLQRCTSHEFSMLEGWNLYLTYGLKDTLDTLDTQDTLHTQDTQDTPKQQIRHYVFFDKIIKSGVSGRYLELYFPLYVLAGLIAPEVLEKTISVSLQLINEKKAEDVLESRDVSLLDFLYQSSNLESVSEYLTMKTVTDKFKDFLGVQDEKYSWVSPDWVGRALKRLNLIKEKRRLRKGVEVLIDFDKAKKTLAIFKELPEDPKE
jgi:hypothetical protein